PGHRQADNRKSCIFVTQVASRHAEESPRWARRSPRKGLLEKSPEGFRSMWQGPPPTSSSKRLISWCCFGTDAASARGPREEETRGGKGASSQVQVTLALTSPRSPFWPSLSPPARFAVIPVPSPARPARGGGRTVAQVYPPPARQQVPGWAASVLLPLRRRRPGDRVVWGAASSLPPRSCLRQSRRVGKRKRSTRERGGTMDSYLVRPAERAQRASGPVPRRDGQEGERPRRKDEGSTLPARGADDASVPGRQWRTEAGSPTGVSLLPPRCDAIHRTRAPAAATSARSLLLNACVPPTNAATGQEECIRLDAALPTDEERGKGNEVGAA
ncbi:hypothetical protein THAOC_20518, partial [Thalassiosira oceanica]